MFQDGSHEIIWPWTTLAQCVYSSPQQHASVQAHCVQGQNQIGKGEASQKEHGLRPLLDLSLHTISYNTSRNQLPFCRAYHSASTAVDTHCWEIWQFWSEDIQRRSIRIRTVHVTKQNCLNLSNALLIPWASLQTVSRSINFHFKVLFIFPWQYLFSIGLVPIFSFRRSLPPILDCISKQPNWLVHNVRHTRLSPSSMCRPKQLKHSASSLKALLEATIRCCKQQRF